MKTPPVAKRRAAATPLSPADFVPFDGLPGVAALARDSSLRQLWCNHEYTEVTNTSAKKLRGSTIWDVLPAALADERAVLMEPALRDGSVVTFHQLYRGLRYVTRVHPLDPKAFGTRGIFVVLSPAVHPVLARPTLPAQMPLAVTPDLGTLDTLTRRELEVLYSVAEGATAQQISQQLHVALKTIERHCESIFRKLGLPNRASVVRFAVERGILGFPRDQWIALAARVRDIDPDAESVLQSSYSLRSLSDSTSAKRIRT